MKDDKSWYKPSNDVMSKQRINDKIENDRWTRDNSTLGHRFLLSHTIYHYYCYNYNKNSKPHYFQLFEMGHIARPVHSTLCMLFY